MPRQKIDRKELVKSALKVFRERGYHKTTMADIGSACGLLKGSIYHYYSGKEELMKGVLESLRGYYRDKVFSVAFDKTLLPEERLRLLALEAERTFLEEKGGCFFTAIGLETIHVVDDFSPMIRGFFEDWISCLKFIFCEEMPEKEAGLFAEEAVAEIEGAVLLMQVFDNPEFLLRTNKALLKRFEEIKKIPSPIK